MPSLARSPLPMTSPWRWCRTSRIPDTGNSQVVVQPGLGDWVGSTTRLARVSGLRISQSQTVAPSPPAEAAGSH
eukprot:7786100-Pyramimonas_sp.AAC.1